MEFKGTKGKWKYYMHDRNCYVVSTQDGRGLFISGHHSNPHETKANALLISKAPEMLEMLQKIVLMTENCNGAFEDFRERYNTEIKQLIKEATELQQHK